jgi:hypothetical protein
VPLVAPFLFGYHPKAALIFEIFVKTISMEYKSLIRMSNIEQRFSAGDAI